MVGLGCAHVMRRRPRNSLEALVSNLTGKGKKDSSVLNKSKEDWLKFKESDGKDFVHDMEQAKKDGYAQLLPLPKSPILYPSS